LEGSPEEIRAMNLRAFFEKTIYSSLSEESFCKRFLLFPLYLISLLYHFLIQLRYTLYKTGILKSYNLPCRVISIGNITMGGTGKTPTVIYLAQLFKGKGLKTAVLSRGYKGKSSEKIAVVSDGERILLSPEDAGDEPFLLSKALPGVPIIIGRDRVHSGRYAIERFSPEIVLLDDGFHHLKLRRDADILLIDLYYGFGNGHLLPRGVLREPLIHLNRAHLFLLTKRADSKDDQVIKNKIISFKPDAQIFFASYEIKYVTPLGEGKEIDRNHLKEKKVLALSGIANPHYFSYLLRQEGMSVIEEWRLPDHHCYTSRDVSKLSAYLNRVDFIVTTAKDSTKMDKENFKNLPILVLEIMLKIHDEQGFKKALFKLIS
jgi:tetraacyldisaccharide 4'-kinase